MATIELFENFLFPIDEKGGKIMMSNTAPEPLSNPYGLLQKYHIDKDMNWVFDPSISPQSVFQIKKIIGQGGFGAVAHVFSIATQQSFAGKIINNSVADQKTEESVQKEISILKMLKSPHIIRYYGSLQWENSKMLLLEYSDKGNFRQILDAKHDVLNENQISIVIHDLVKAIKVLHDKKIVHCDIKAANLLLNSKGDVKLCDFGGSRLIGDDTDGKNSKSVIGTPYWMSPEVISGDPYMYPSDIWSIGITAVELAEGAPPLAEFPPTKAMIEIARNGFIGLRRPQDHSQLFTSFIINCLINDPNLRPSISQLMTHPFVTRAETLNRKTEFANLMDVTLPEYSSIDAIPQRLSPPTSVSNQSSCKLPSARDLSPRSSNGQSSFNFSSMLSNTGTIPSFGSFCDSSFATPGPFVSSNPDYAKICSTDYTTPRSGMFSHDSGQICSPNVSFDGVKHVKKHERVPIPPLPRDKKVPRARAAVEFPVTFQELSPESNQEYSQSMLPSENGSLLTPHARKNVSFRKPRDMMRHSERLDPLELQEQFKVFMKEEGISSPNFRRDVFENDISKKTNSASDPDFNIDLDKFQPTQMPCGQFDIDFETSGKQPTKLESIFL